MLNKILYLCAGKTMEVFKGCTVPFFNLKVAAIPDNKARESPTTMEGFILQGFIFGLPYWSKNIISGKAFHRVEFISLS
jgi:hypothetical protein